MEKSWAWWHTAVITAMVGSVKWEDCGKKARSYLKNNQRKRAGSMVQVVECLHSKYKALSSNPSTTPKKSSLK
jgi:hypothetical protein